MSNHEEKSPRSARKQPTVASMLSRFWKILSHNWGWKLGCLLLAVFLWGWQITQDGSLTRSKVFADVEIAVRNRNILEQNGLTVVSGLEPEQLKGLTIRANVPQASYQQADAKNYTPYVDLSQITSVGTQEIPIQTTSTTRYGSVTKDGLSFSTLKIEVEEYVIRSRIPVQVSYFGEVSDQFYLPEPKPDPSYVSIAGPRSLVSAVSRLVVPFDRSQLTPFAGTVKTALPFILEDTQGNEISQALIRVSPLNTGVIIDAVTVEQEMRQYQKVDINVETAVTGQPAPGYRVKSVLLEPASVNVAPKDPETDLSAVQLTVANPAKLTGMTETLSYYTLMLNSLNDTLSSSSVDAYYMKTRTALMTVEIVPIEEETEEAPETGAEDP